MDFARSAASGARGRSWAPEASDLSLAVLIGVLTAYMGLRDGGFFPGTPAFAAAEVAVCIALTLVIARRPFDGIGLPVIIGAAALAGLAAWTLASSGWSETPVRATLEYTRVLLYVLTFVLYGMLAYSVRRIRWMLYAVAVASVAICALGLVARTLPDVLFWEGLATEDRLGYPLNYWNALALLAGIGIIFCGHLTCNARESWWARVLGAAAIPLLTATLYYTLSRGGTWGTFGGVVLYLLVARPRAILSGAVATVPPVGAMLIVLNPPNDLTDPRWAVPEAVAAGHRAALAIALAVGAAAVLRVVMLPADGLVLKMRLPEHVRRPAMAGATLALVVTVLVAGLALRVPDVVGAKYSEFRAKDSNRLSEGGSRLLSARNNGRQEHWDVALAAFRRDRLHGSGAGMYSVDWARDRPNSASVQDAHSLYFELLGELGLPGLVLLLLPLLLILGGFAYRARGSDRALFAALLACGVAWAAQAGVDWLWEMPAVTLWMFAFGGAVLARGARADSSLPTWTIAVRVAGVGLCIAVLILPARVAVSQAQIDSGLDAFDAGRCQQAKADARNALSTVPSRALPYVLIAACDLEQRRPAAAVRALENAVERDPFNYELHYELAVARARAGLDPRRALRRARALNPGAGRVKLAVEAFRFHNNRKRWRRVGRMLELRDPGPPIP